MTGATRNTPPNDWLRQGSAILCCSIVLFGEGNFARAESDVVKAPTEIGYSFFLKNVFVGDRPIEVNLRFLRGFDDIDDLLSYGERGARDNFHSKPIGWGDGGFNFNHPRISGFVKSMSFGNWHSEDVQPAFRNNVICRSLPKVFIRGINFNAFADFQLGNLWLGRQNICAQLPLRVTLAGPPETAGTLPQSKSENCDQDRGYSGGSITKFINETSTTSSVNVRALDERGEIWWRVFIGLLGFGGCLALYARLKR